MNPNNELFTNKEYNDFCEAVFNKDTKNIENSKIIKLLDKILKDDNNPLVLHLPKGTKLYRAREIDVEKAYKDASYGVRAKFGTGHVFSCSGYNYYESKEAPLSSTMQGRNNIVGMSYLYLSEEPYTACAEIKPEIRGLISLATFNVEKNLKILDFYDRENFYDDEEFTRVTNMNVGQILNYIFTSFNTICNKEKHYLITQYISDYVRKAGFDGIKYCGAMNYGTNYTIFNSHKSNISFVESKIIATAGVQYAFYDIEKKERIQFENDTYSELNCESIQNKLAANIRKARR